MVNEVRYATYMEDSLVHEEVDLDTFLKLYINHRPVLPLNSSQIVGAFDTLAKEFGGDGQLSWAELKNMLVGEGEAISQDDLQAYLAALLGEEAQNLDVPGKTFNSHNFADEVLGFEDM